MSLRLRVTVCRVGRNNTPAGARATLRCSRRARAPAPRRARAETALTGMHAPRGPRPGPGYTEASDGGTISFEPMHRTFITLTRLIQYPVSVSDLFYTVVYTRKTARGKNAQNTAPRAPRAATYPGPTSYLRSMLRLVRRLASGLRHAGRHWMQSAQ